MVLLVQVREIKPWSGPTDKRLTAVGDSITPPSPGSANVVAFPHTLWQSYWALGNVKPDTRGS